ncbi:MAG TPA: hypothetical protein VFP94_06100 [Terriglobales bacterium]|nr:hypothetical protein [Terriglobales bacterium]
MRHTLSVRLPADLAAWLKQQARRDGLPVGQLVRVELERARNARFSERLLRHAGVFSGGPRDVSTRKGFARK